MSQIEIDRYLPGYDTDCTDYENDMSKVVTRSDCVSECIRQLKDNNTGSLQSKRLIHQGIVSRYTLEDLEYLPGIDLIRHCESTCNSDCKIKYYKIDDIKSYGADIQGRDPGIFINIEHSNSPDLVVTHYPEVPFIALVCNFGGLVVGPNQALIVSGGCCAATKKQLIVGGWSWAWWFVTDVKKLPLTVMTLSPRCESVETAEGVLLTVSGTAQCKIMTDEEFLMIAAEQFLGKNVTHIKSMVEQTLEGHLRAILGTLTVEEVYRDRNKFAALVREVATPDVGRMGIEIMSFTIKDVFDNVDYLASLGKSRTAAVKRDANIGVAQAEREAGIREAVCEKLAMDVKYSADTKIEDSHRHFLLEKARFDTEVNAMKAEAQLAYELTEAKMQQKIRNEEIEINVVERRKEIDVQEKEVLRKDNELKATVKLPADAEVYKMDQLARGHKTKKIQITQAEAHKTKMMGAAEAFAISAVGNAEAERMALKAEAYKMYEEAAVLSMTLKVLPKIAAEVASPLVKTGDIVLISDGNCGLNSEVSRWMSQIPPTVKALTGVDLLRHLTKLEHKMK